jgi:hypothetical protein
MNPKLTAILIYSAKNAVNASLLTLTPIWQDPSKYNVSSWSGLLHVLGLMGSAVAVREGMIWGPRIMKWSQTNGTDIDK